MRCLRASSRKRVPDHSRGTGKSIKFCYIGGRARRQSEPSGKRSSTAVFFNVQRSFSLIALETGPQRINREIPAPEVSLVAENGDHPGITQSVKARGRPERANAAFVDI